MAAPQIAGTPAVAPAAVEVITAGTHGIDAVLGDLSAEDTADEPVDALDALPGSDEATEAPVEPDAPRAPQAPISIDDLLTDEALSTPEGVRASGEKLRELATKQRESYLKLKGFEKNVLSKAGKLKAKVDSFRSEKQTHQLLIDNVRSNLQGLHSNDPDTILTALGNLTGTDGFKAYELLTSRIVNRGQAQLDPQVQHLLDQQSREIQELKTGLQQREQQQRNAAELAHANQQISVHAQNIGAMVRGSTTTPHLTRIFNQNPTKLTEDIIQAITDDNGATPAGALFAQMEAELQAHFGGPPQLGTNGGTVQQPQRAQRSPGQSVGPRTAVAATTREPSEEEALKALSEDPELLRSLGL